MKTMRLSQKVVLTALAVMAVAGVAALAGCSGTVGQEITDKMDALEARIVELEDKIEGKIDSVAKEEADAGDVAATYSTTGSYADYEGYLKALNKRVVDAVADSEAVEVPSDAAMVPSAFQHAVTPLEALEDEVGHLEDAFEAASAQGYVTSDELGKLKSKANGIDEALDHAIDKLEKRMGMDVDK